MGAWTKTWIFSHALSLWLCSLWEFSSQLCKLTPFQYIPGKSPNYMRHGFHSYLSLLEGRCWSFDKFWYTPFLANMETTSSNIHMIWDPIVQDEFSVAESVWWVHFGSGKLQDLYLKTDESIIQNHQTNITKWKKLQFFRSFTGSWDFFDKIYTLWRV